MPTSTFNRFYPPGSGNWHQDRRERQWVRTTNYSSVDRRLLPENPYTDFQLTGSASEAVMSKTNKATGSTTYTKYSWPQNNESLQGLITLGDYPNSGISSEESLLNEALVKALLKVSDSKANLGVMFAEKVKTSELILGKAKQTYDAYRAFKKGDFQAVRRILNIPPGRTHKAWLEYAYGWKPLLMEVHGAAEFLAQQFLHEKPYSFTVSSTAKSKGKWRSKAPGGFGRIFPTLENAFYSVDSERTARVKLSLEVSNKNLANLQQLGMTNPALVAWELVPFSFVFDWFISVGDYVQALTALHGITVTRAMQSHLFVGTGNCTETCGSYSGLYDSYSGFAMMRELKWRRYRRDPLTVNVLKLRPPTDFSVPHWSRCVSAIALMRAAATS